MPGAPQSESARRIAVAGNPNCGKSTLFNALTGLSQKVANFPGVTVEKREGSLRNTPSITLIDLPGSYSLSARSPDELIPRDLLLGRLAGDARPDAVLVVADASNLERNLYLASQVLELRLPTLVACNMTDRAEASGRPVDMAELEHALCVPVIATVGHRKIGADRLIAALADGEPRLPPARPWCLPAAAEEEVSALAARLTAAGLAPAESADGAALLWLTDAASAPGGGAKLDLLPAAAGPLLQAALAALRARGFDDAAGMIIDARYSWITDVTERVIRPAPDAGLRAARSDRLDRWLTHGATGMLFFAAVVTAMFASIFWLAEPMMGLIEQGQTLLQGVVRSLLSPGPLRDLLADGVVGGVGSVIVFFPQICLLFLFVAIMEDSGYMSRAAFLMHKLMSRAGLPGKSFIPLLSSFACAIPGIMATRVIDDRRDRFTTILVAPLMSCSARLPVYLTVISVVFGGRVWVQTGVILGMYAIGVVTALLVARLLKSTLLRGPHTPFLIELPAYSMPRPAAVLKTMWERGMLFLTGAGTTIFALCILLWALAYFPRDRETREQVRADRAAALADAGLDAGEATLWSDDAPAALPEAERAEWAAQNRLLASRQLERSLLGRMGRAIEPLVEPLGFDWRIGVAVTASFAAREVFVGTMGTLYSVADAEEEGSTLRERMRADRWGAGPRAGRPVYTVACGLSIMVFFVLCCQCMSTLAVARRETNSLRWPAFMFAYMTALAYGGAWITYQAVSRLTAE